MFVVLANVWFSLLSLFACFSENFGPYWTTSSLHFSVRQTCSANHFILEKNPIQSPVSCSIELVLHVCFTALTLSETSFKKCFLWFTLPFAVLVFCFPFSKYPFFCWLIPLVFEVCFYGAVSKSYEPCTHWTSAPLLSDTPVHLPRFNRQHPMVASEKQVHEK